MPEIIDEVLIATTDRLELLNRFASYAHLYDNGDSESLADLFTQDAQFVMHAEVGQVPPSMSGRSAIVAGLVGKWEWVRPAQRRHFGTNPVVLSQTISSAEVVSYLLLVETRDGLSSILATGRYHDHWVKDAQDGKWRILLRNAYPDSVVP